MMGKTDVAAGHVERGKRGRWLSRAGERVAPLRYVFFTFNLFLLASSQKPEFSIYLGVGLELSSISIRVFACYVFFACKRPKKRCFDIF